MRAPHTRAADTSLAEPLTDPADPRLQHRFAPWDGSACDATLVGVPFDEGVRLNGGRAGAGEGPAALRAALSRFGTTYDAELAVDFDGLRLRDAGDVEPVERDVRATHDRVAKCVAALLEHSRTVVVVGGGNDVSFASASALARRAPAIGVVNVDAHLDVREVVDGRLGSGTPYRRVIEELGVPGARFVELGTHPHVNSRAHHEWLKARGATCWPLGALREAGVEATTRAELARLATDCDALMLSVDLDVFAAAYAPGVSAPGTDGLAPAEGRAIALAAGRQAKLRVFELMELAPRHDVDARTARLAAMLLAAFLCGVATRG